MTINNNLLTNIEQKTVCLGNTPCLLSLHAVSLSLAVDACRLTKVFEMTLENWQQCLPLGEACDVNFPSWGAKIWEMMKTVRNAYNMNKVNVNLYEYESECFVDFKEAQQGVAFDKSSQSLFQDTKVEDIPTILICALRDLNEVLMEISEFLNSPTEELIEVSWRQWQENYRKHYLKACKKDYQKWKISFSSRTLKKHLEDKRREALEAFRQQFLNDDEFEQVFDSEQMSLDIDGLSRFLFTHTDRFGVSYIDEIRPFFSQELLALFTFVELWTMIGNDLQPSKKRKEKASPQEDELETKVFALLAKLNDVVSEEWTQQIATLWKHIFKEFRKEIAQAGVREKFKEFSKKTLYCIVGYLKKRNVYRSEETFANVTKMLEGENNGMRKYINNGLLELEESLRQRVKEFIDAKIESLTPDPSFPSGARHPVAIPKGEGS